MKLENNPTIKDLTISTNKSQLDIDYIANFLINDSYWANDRNKEQIRKSIDNSICFGLYYKDQQMGFARVITDQVVFSYIMDVFIDKEFQGKGYGQYFMDYIYHHEALLGVKKHYLITKDAQEFYKKIGFKVYPQPDRIMVKHL